MEMAKEVEVAKDSSMIKGREDVKMWMTVNFSPGGRQERHIRCRTHTSRGAAYTAAVLEPPSLRCCAIPLHLDMTVRCYGSAMTVLCQCILLLQWKLDEVAAAAESSE